MEDILLYENPYTFPGMGVQNPRKSKKKRNPNMKNAVKNAVSFKGVNVQDIIGSIAGFVASAMVPGYAIKPSTTNPTLSSWAKGGKIALGLAIAVLGKGLGDAIIPGMGKSWMYGGFAGTGALAYKEFAPTTYPPLINRQNPVGHAAPRPAGLPSAAQMSGPASGSIGRNTNDEFSQASVY